MLELSDIVKEIVAYLLYARQIIPSPLIELIRQHERLVKQIKDLKSHSNTIAFPQSKQGRMEETTIAIEDPIDDGLVEDHLDECLDDKEDFTFSDIFSKSDGSDDDVSEHTFDSLSGISGLSESPPHTTEAIPGIHRFRFPVPTRKSLEAPPRPQLLPLSTTATISPTLTTPLDRTTRNQPSRIKPPSSSRLLGRLSRKATRLFKTIDAACKLLYSIECAVATSQVLAIHLYFGTSVSSAKEVISITLPQDVYCQTKRLQSPYNNNNQSQSFGALLPRTFLSEASDIFHEYLSNCGNPTELPGDVSRQKLDFLFGKRAVYLQTTSSAIR